MINIRTKFINDIIDNRKYNKYLEIGASQQHNFSKINVENKVCVDPDPNSDATFVLTSDDYFEKLDRDAKFDIVFIDGLHETEQVDKDIKNSLEHLTSNGIILCHDCLPCMEIVQVVPREDESYAWYGDVWKSILKLRSTNPNVKIHTAQVCTGICMITKSKTPQELYIDDNMVFTWEYYRMNNNKFMNIVTENQVYKSLGIEGAP